VIARITTTTIIKVNIMVSFFKKSNIIWKNYKEIKKSQKQLKKLVKLSRLLRKHERYDDSLKAMKIAVELLDYMMNKQFTSKAAKKECKRRLVTLIEECKFIMSEQQKKIAKLRKAEKNKEKKIDKQYFEGTTVQPAKQHTKEQLLKKGVLEAWVGNNEELQLKASEVVAHIATTRCNTVEAASLKKAFYNLSESHYKLDKQKKELEKEKLQNEQKQNSNEKKECEISDEEKELKEIRQSFLNSMKADRSTYKFSDVIGVEDAKEGLYIALCQQNIFVRSYQTKNLEKCKGIMLFG
jgi:hypothetical protein